MRRKTLSINVSAVLLSTILLAKLTVELVNRKKKVEEIYLELACTIGVLLLCLVATVLLIREKKEYNKVERSNSNLSLDSSDEEVKEGEKQQPLNSSVSCPEGLTDETIPVEGVRDEVKKINSTMVKEDKGKIDKYYNLTGQQLSVKNFGQDESIIAITLPESYSIKKYKNGEEIKSTKNGIIDDGDKYKPVDFSVNKVEKINDKDKKEDSYQFIFKFQNVQKDDVFIEISCSTLNVYSGWKKNNEKPVAQYFNDLNIKAKEAQEEISKGAGIKRKELKKLEERAVKVNDDFLIFLDVGKILSGSLGAIVKFVGRLFPANVQGLSSVTEEGIFKHFDVELLDKEENSYINIKDYHFFSKNKENENSTKGDKKSHKSKAELPILNILINNQLISKEQEVEQEHQNDVDQDIQVDGPTNQNVIVDEEMPDIPQLQNKEDEINPLNVNSAPPSPSISSGIGSDRTSISDTAITESKEKSAQKQPVSRSSSKNSLRSQGSVDSADKSKSKLKKGVKNFIEKTRNVFTKDKSKEGDEESIDGTKEEREERRKFSLKKLIKNNKGSKKTPPSPSISTSSVKSVGGDVDNLVFEQGKDGIVERIF